MKNQDLLHHVRTIPDFPEPGILFYDITTLLQQPTGLRDVVDRMTALWDPADIDCVVGIDARGFILGGAIAYVLNCGLVLVRKAGKLPYKTQSVQYQLEYGTATLEVHTDALEGGKRALIIDDLLATGGTAAATAKLVNESGGRVAGYGFVIEIAALGGRDRLQGPIKSLIEV